MELLSMCWSGTHLSLQKSCNSCSSQLKNRCLARRGKEALSLVAAAAAAAAHPPRLQVKGVQGNEIFE
jgi:hypothetical protein